MKITQIWESPTNEGTLLIVLGHDYTDAYDHRLKGFGKCLSIIGKQGFYEITFENGVVYLGEAAVGTRLEAEE